MLQTYIAFCIGIFGIIMGSFLNVVASRHNVKTLSGRSHCPKCGTTLNWYELVPVVSYIALMGRCRSCQSKISPRYIVVELSVGVASFVHASLAPDILTLVFGLCALYISTVLFLYDMQSRFLPLNIMLLLIMFGIISVVSNLYVTTVHTVAFFVLLFYATLPALFLFLLSLCSRGKWMGMGDSILLIGLTLYAPNPSVTLTTLILSSWIGAVYGIGKIIHTKLQRKKQYDQHIIAFGPSIIISFFLSWWIYIVYGSLLI